MASLIQRNGNYSVRFCLPDGSRKTVALGTKSRDRATTLKKRIAKLVACAKTGDGFDDELILWIAKVPPKLKRLLIDAQLLPADKSQEVLGLAEFLAEYKSRRTDVKLSTTVNWRHTIRNLVEFFGDDKPIDQINRADAKDFVIYLKTQARSPRRKKDIPGLSPDTVRKRVSNAKQFLADAVDRHLIPENPFQGLDSSTKGNRDRDYFVTREETGKVLAACPDREWRLLFGLSRFGGLRCPSEHLGLRLSDVDWERERLRITAPKTEHHNGKGHRWIPLFPELRPFIEECWEAAEPNQEYFITRYRATNANLRTQLIRIIRRAGLEPWPKLFQNLRSTRQTELEEVFPSHVVCAWIGNSRQVATKHYLQVTETHFEEAVSGARTKCSQQGAAPGRK